MRTIALARVVAVAAAIAASLTGTASAQLAVYDPFSALKQIEQIGQLKAQLDQLKAQYDQAQALYGSLNRLTDMNSIATVLNDNAVRNALPRDFSGIESLFRGAGGNAGFYASANSNYASPGNDFYTRELARVAQQTAGQQSVAQAIYEGASRRMDGLEQLRQRLSTATDAKEVLDLQARIQVEQGNVQNDLLRMQGLRMMQQAQIEVSRQRRQEEQRRQIDAFGSALR